MHDPGKLLHADRRTANDKSNLCVDLIKLDSKKKLFCGYLRTFITLAYTQPVLAYAEKPGWPRAFVVIPRGQCTILKLTVSQPETYDTQSNSSWYRIAKSRPHCVQRPALRSRWPASLEHQACGLNFFNGSNSASNVTACTLPSHRCFRDR